MQDAILARIDSFADWAVELQRGLTAIPALSPDNGGDGELAKTEWLQAELARLAFDTVERFDAPDPRAAGGVRPNLVARLRGASSARTLWIMSHLDIVPPGDLSKWHGDPYVLRVEDGRLFGRGVEDNQQAVVSSLLVARAFIEAGVRPPVDLALLFCADEETGSHYGAHYLADHHPGLFGPADMFLVPDAGQPDGSLVEVAEKSIWWLRVRTTGVQCHASTPELGVNAFRAASALVTSLGSLYTTFNAVDPVFAPPISTFEPTKKEANVPNINTLPGDDVFYVDCRVLPCYPLAEVEAEIRRLAAEVEQAWGVSIAMEDVQRAQAAPPTSLDSDVVRTLLAAVKQVHGIAPEPRGIGGGTVAAVFRQLGLPAVVYSRLEETAHQPNESCLLENVISDAKVFALTALGA